MLSVALTGNIASGKSTVLELFRSWGAFTTDADAIVRDLQRPGTAVSDAIVARFGPEVVAGDGTLDRAALRRLVFADPGARAALEAIVHPAVERRRQELERQAIAAGARIAVHDIPLLFEAADPARFDRVVLVDAPPPLRRARILTRPGVAPAEADRMMAAQLPGESKRSRAHYIIDNDGSLDQLRARARQTWEALLADAGAAA